MNCRVKMLFYAFVGRIAGAVRAQLMQRGLGRFEREFDTGGPPPDRRVQRPEIAPRVTQILQERFKPADHIHVSCPFFQKSLVTE